MPYCPTHDYEWSDLRGSCPYCKSISLLSGTLTLSEVAEIWPMV
jgi:hypothetical protein